jgi:hypothetical protein
LKLNIFFALFVAGLIATTANAGPWVKQGSSELRSDIQILADAGIIGGAITTWPLSWGDISTGLQDPPDDMPPYVAAAYYRVNRRALEEMQVGEWKFEAKAGATSNPRQIRTFENTLRQDAEVGVGVNWTGDLFAVRLTGEYAHNPSDGDEWRLDGSYAGVALGNWMLSVNALDRWWGPGWQGSGILSNNARPIPALMLERNSTRAFKQKWLAWIGAWDLATFWGQLDEDSAVPNANLFGLRVNFRPLKSLEIGFSRTAQMCGDGRPCSLSTFFDMLVGNDNVGQGTTEEEEPGNQLAGWDVRWSNTMTRQPFALYLQITGEDLEGWRPSGEFPVIGGETWGSWDKVGTYRLYVEWTDTVCNWAPGDPHKYDCVYNHHIYKDGYRYNGKSIGHSVDNDAKVMTIGGVIVDHKERTWLVTTGYGKLNRKDNSDPRNTVASDKTDYWEVEASHKRPLWIGEIFTGLGFEYRKNTITNVTEDDVRVFFEWRTGY